MVNFTIHVTKSEKKNIINQLVLRMFAQFVFDSRGVNTYISAPRKILWKYCQNNLIQQYHVCQCHFAGSNQRPKGADKKSLKGLSFQEMVRD
jgi:hypothetical protein